jgi:TRAP-type mannitol/chloroaromatic compound transport system permease small subunit
MRRFIALVDRFSDASGRAIAWLTLLMVVVTFLVVVLRYLFDLGWIWLQESVTWMHAAVLMLGAAYTLRHEEHVRVDVFYRKRDARGRAWVDIFGAVFFLIPMCVFLLWSSFVYVGDSWGMQEASREAGGLPYPLVPLMKTLIPLAALLLIVQGLADLVRNIGVVRGWALPKQDGPTSAGSGDVL